MVDKIPIMQGSPLKGNKQKRFNVLRLSLTRKCNFNCMYCTTAETKIKNHSISTQELLGIVKKLHMENRFKKIRITGGEPLLIPNIVDYVSEIKSFGISEIHMTTNGASLAKLAERLKLAGLKGVNISLDAINSYTYNKITRTDKLDSVLEGITRAQNAGLVVKLNAVLLKGINEEEILPLFEYSLVNNIQIRFLEFMESTSGSADLYLPVSYAIKKIGSRYEIKKLGKTGSETSEKWITKQGYQFGFIANSSTPFCEECDRLRMDSSGSIYGCIGATDSISILGIHPEKYNEVLDNAMQQKNSRFFTGIGPAMRSIGG